MTKTIHASRGEDKVYQKLLEELEIPKDVRLPFREYVFVRSIYFIRKLATDKELNTLQVEIDNKMNEVFRSADDYLARRKDQLAIPIVEKITDVLQDPLTDEIDRR